MKAQLVSENINFQRGVNPLGSMGLGGFSFDTLRPGAILRSKRFFGVSKSTGNIGGYNSSSIRISKDQYLLVTDIWDLEGGKKNISWKKFGKLEWALEQREKLKEDGKRSLAWYGITSGFFDNLTKRRFDYRLEIVEPGFHINESVNFQRGKDPKRALKIGQRTWERLKPGDILIPKRDFKIDRYGTPMPPSRKGGLFFYGDGDLNGGKSILVVVRVRQSSVFSSSRPEAQITNGLEITSFETWTLDDALKVREQIENGTFDVDVFRKPIKATIPALKSRLDIYEG